MQALSTAEVGENYTIQWLFGIPAPPSCRRRWQRTGDSEIIQWADHRCQWRTVCHGK